MERIPDYYERLKSSYDARFYQQEALGEYLSLNAGRVYYAFERGENVRDDGAVDEGRPLLWALDFNVDPMCSVVAQVDGERVTVLDEIVLARASTFDACEEFERRFPSHAAGLVIYADATGARLQTSGTTDVEILQQSLRRRSLRRGGVQDSEVESGGEGPGDADEREARVGGGGAKDDGCIRGARS